MNVSRLGLAVAVAAAIGVAGCPPMHRTPVPSPAFAMGAKESVPWFMPADVEREARVLIAQDAGHTEPMPIAMPAAYLGGYIQPNHEFPLPVPAARDPQACAEAAYALGRMGARAAPAARLLMKRLMDPSQVTDPATGEGPVPLADVAERALIEIGEPAVRPLFDGLLVQSSDQWVGFVAPEERVCRIFVAIGDTAVGVLAGRLQSWDKDERRTAARMLGEMKLKSGVPSLIRAIDDGDPAVVQAAVESLFAIGDPRAAMPLAELLHRKRWPREFGRGTAVSIADLGDPEVIGLLIDTMRQGFGKGKTSATYEAAVASEMLKGFGPAAVEPLLAAIDTGDVGFTYEVIDLLGEIGDRRAIRPMVERLRTKPDHGGKPADALAKLGSEAVEPVLTLLDDPNADVRRYGIVALQYMKDPRGFDPLVRMLGDGDSDVRRWAAFALAYSKDLRAVQPLLAGFAKWRQDDMVLAIAQIGGPRAAAIVRAAFGDPDKYVRLGAAEAAKLMMDREAVPGLIAMLRDSEAEVRLKAVRVLGEIGDKAAVLPLAAAAEHDDSGSVREFAAESLGKLGSTEAIPALLRVALFDSNAWARSNAMAALKKLTGRDFGTDANAWWAWWKGNGE